MDNQKINWYPGHMAKARRQMEEQIKKADLILEICDARMPFSSRNPDLNKMIGSRKRLLILNKSDLANETVNRRWLGWFQSQGTDAVLLSSLRMNRKELLDRIDKNTREITEKALLRGMKKTIRAMVIGVPNVGKSTMINRLRGNSIAQTGDRPGVTRASQVIRVTPYLELMDTPGLLWPRLDDQNAARRLCYIGTIRDETVDLYALTAALLEELKTLAPQALAERYHLKDLSGDSAKLMEEICRGRGWLLKGGEADLERCCNVVLDEFRGGKIGRISLEEPQNQARNTVNQSDDEKAGNRNDGPDGESPAADGF
ncbi:MAG: ribosome biogenesis GTPase YlqF [Clostridia bacterium]|nr:ribosome biogenesis GTPase YlqF [Clostridia bacterium]